MHARKFCNDFETSNLTYAIADVEELVITHITNPFHANTQPLIDDAKLHFQGPVIAANDLTVVTVATP